MNSSSFSFNWRNIVVPVGVVISLVVNVGWIPGAKADLVPQKHVQVRMEGFNLTGTYSVVGGQPTGVGQFKNGNAGEYPEGSCIPSLISVKNNDNAAGDIQVTPYFDYGKDSSFGIVSLKQITTGLSDPSVQADDLNDFTYPGSDLSTATSFMTDAGGTNAATISGPYSGQDGAGAPAVGDTVRHYNVLLQNVAKGETVLVLFCAQLHVNASEYGGGASMSIRTGEGGSENIAVQAVKLLVLPKLTLTKVVEGGTATADQWSFHVSPSISGQSDFPIAAGQDSVIIDNIEPDGIYVITETGGPSNYQFKGGSGTNCAFSGSAASTTLAAAKPQQTATCVFTNEYVPPVVMPKLTVTKVVVNDNGGTAVVSDFPLFVDGNPVTSGQQNAFATGTRTVSETGSSSYTPTFSGDCDSAGQVSLAEGDVKSCTVTNDDIYTATTATLTVVKQIVNDNGGTKVSGDFTLNVTGSNVSNPSFAGSASGVTVTLDAGAYSVDENSDPGYSKTVGTGCFGTLTVGQSQTCTITNDDVDTSSGWTATTGTLMVIKQVVNDDSGTKSPGDFTLTVNGTNPSQTSFAGSTSGVSVTLDAGSYTVDENADSGYAKSLGANCSGTLAAGDTKTCIVTNDDIYTATTATLTVIKLVVNDDNGKKEPSDFKLDVSGTSPLPASFDGSSSGTTVVLGAGSYSVTEKGGGNYDASYSAGCSGTIAAGESRTCTVTNDDRKPGGGGGGGGGGFEATTGTLTVIKLVKNDYGGTKLAGDFTLTVSGTSPSLSSFAGSSSGSVVVLGAGAYQVDEIEDSAYAKSLGAGCTGTLAAGESLTCTVTNSQKPTSPVDTADLSVAKSASASSIQTGTSLDYFIDLINIGPDAATNAQVADVLPTGFIYQSSVASQGFYSTSTGIWTVGAMAVNATATLSMNVTVTAAAGLYVNTATATALEYDPVSGNNVTSTSVTVTAAGGSGGGGGGSGGGGGTVVYIYDPPIGGGSGGSNPAPAVSPAVLPPPATEPVPQVLGAVDEVLALAPEAAPPVPRVLGAVDELPRTGIPAWTLLAVISAAVVALRRKQ
ncbi:DUF11 domain-containing protein [Candidatus Uhrbacteria bacterium]|nr:DUF11 domain-containing protein [Candidatus Uhrbacteria bacterium]